MVKVTCAADCALALNSRGEVFGWGNSEYGQFSMVTEDQQLHTPTHLHLGLGEEKVVDIASGGTTCTILTQSGRCVGLRTFVVVVNDPSTTFNAGFSHGALASWDWGPM